MPTYEYNCPKCRTTVTKIVRMSDRDQLLKCHECATPMQRLFSAPAVHFSGAGFPGNDMKKRR